MQTNFNAQSSAIEYSSKRSSVKPNVYFRGVNRVHVNRFKAYLLTLSNRLNSHWTITQELSKANVVIEWKATEDAENKCLLMSVYAESASLKNQPIESFALNLEENELARKLNQASKKLAKLKRNQVKKGTKTKQISVCGLLNESLSELCQQLNTQTNTTKFIPAANLFSDKTDHIKTPLLLLVDPQSTDSIQTAQVLMQKKVNGSLTVNELTIVIMSAPDEEANERAFDLIYDQADDQTQVTLLDFTNESALDAFVHYF